MEIAKIREAKPNGTTHFREHQIIGAIYYRVDGKSILCWTEKDLGFWQKTELTLKDLADLGAMPIDYEPIDWVKKLENI
ncbi:hypothetical protein [Acinetobacter modestus]|uniref:hypothetical protein n=1 Tax=Acinetobacter modestus TaxID=1776740 RepID=UPI0030178AE8